jgi:hypothetical protein
MTPATSRSEASSTKVALGSIAGTGDIGPDAEASIGSTERSLAGFSSGRWNFSEASYGRTEKISDADVADSGMS